MHKQGICKYVQRMKMLKTSKQQQKNGNNQAKTKREGKN